MTSTNRESGPIPAWVYASILLTAILSCVSLSMRYRTESLNKRVGIAVDWDTVTSLSASEGMTPEAALRKFKDQGLTALVVGEQTVGEALANEAVLEGGSTAQDLPTFERGRRLRFGSKGMEAIPTGVLRGMSIGLEPDAITAARATDLDVVARLGNPVGGTPGYVEGMIAWAHEDGASYFLPQGDQVLGRRDALDTLRESLIANGMHYCTPEFAKIGGDANVVEADPGNVIRLHSAQSQELDKLSLSGAIERYAKAVSERNQRMILVRPLAFAGDHPLEAFANLLAGINREVTKEGYTLGSPHPFTDSGVPLLLIIGIALAMGPALFWLCTLVLPKRLEVLAAIAFGLLAGLCVKDQGRQVAAVVAATAFPLLAFVMLDHWTKAKKPWLAQFIAVSAVSLVGGLAVAGILNGLPFFVRADVFMGVKLAHFLPIGLIGAYFLWKLTPARENLGNPILWSQAALAVIILAGFAFMASRTGNDGPAGVSGVELAFRSLLEKVLVVRPRTKEFLIGHPAMIVAVGLLIRHRLSGMNKGGWIALLLMVGAIGQTSMVNTMCHLHTPLTVSLTRIGVGLVLGGIIGAISWALISRLPARVNS